MSLLKRKRSLVSWLESVGLEHIQFNSKYVNAKWNLKSPDKEAAWELYVEMITRITIQPLPVEQGDEESALESVYSLFPITREVLKRKGRHAVEFSKIAVPILNQIVRPFTAKWHKAKIDKAFEKKEKCAEFREELNALREDLVKYAHLLAKIAEVEDLTNLEEGKKNDPTT